MPKFFRIEHSISRYGVYKHQAMDNSDLKPFKYISMFKSDKHPMPDEDSLLDANWSRENHNNLTTWNLDVRYGFSSLAQLRNWFYDDKMLVELEERGFIIVIYEVPKVYEGYSQCVIKHNHHETKNIVREYLPTELIAAEKELS